MGTRRRLIAVVIFAFASLACSKTATKTEASRNGVSKPVDHLAAGEVVEGEERAFGLPLPRDSTVKIRFAATVHAVSTLSAEALLAFFRARITPGAGETLSVAGVTTLANVVPLADAKKQLAIDVRAVTRGDGVRSELVVRDTTPEPAAPGLSNEERWRNAGLTPRGKINDPRHLE